MESCVGFLILLGRNIAQLGLLKELEFLADSRVYGLTGNLLVPKSDIGVRLAPRSPVEELEAETNDTGAEDVSESKAVANEEASAVQVLLND